MSQIVKIRQSIIGQNRINLFKRGSVTKEKPETVANDLKNIDSFFKLHHLKLPDKIIPCIESYLSLAIYHTNLKLVDHLVQSGLLDKLFLDFDFHHFLPYVHTTDLTSYLLNYFEKKLCKEIAFSNTSWHWNRLLIGSVICQNVFATKFALERGAKLSLDFYDSQDYDLFINPLYPDFVQNKCTGTTNQIKNFLKENFPGLAT